MAHSSNCGCPPHSPFRWREHTAPSIFARDPLFAPMKNGKDKSQTASESVDRVTERLGRNPNTIYGIERKKTPRRTVTRRGSVA